MLRLGRCRVPVTVETVMMVDSLEMTDADRRRIADACRRAPEDRIVITHGTDTMVETAAVLAQERTAKTIVLTGAMVPWAFGSSDGLFNLGSAISFVADAPDGRLRRDERPLLRLGRRAQGPDDGDVRDREMKRREDSSSERESEKILRMVPCVGAVLALLVAAHAGCRAGAPSRAGSPLLFPSMEKAGWLRGDPSLCTCRGRKASLKVVFDSVALTGGMLDAPFRLQNESGVDLLAVRVDLAVGVTRA